MPVQKRVTHRKSARHSRYQGSMGDITSGDCARLLESEAVCLRSECLCRPVPVVPLVVGQVSFAI